MKAIQSYISCAVSVALLSGCVANQVKSNAQSLDTLKIYPNNHVVLKVYSPSRKTSFSVNDDSTIVAYKFIKPSVGPVIINAVEIAQLDSTLEGRKKVFTVELRDGSKFTTEYYSLYLCDREKHCKTFDRSQYIPLKTYYEDSLRQGSSINFEYKTFPAGDFSSNPNFSNTIDIAAEADAATFTNVTLQKAIEAKKVNEAAAATNVKAQREQEHQAKLAAEKAAISLGKVNCESWGFDLARPFAPFDNKTFLDCTGFRSTVGEMKAKGWIIANVNTFVAPDNVGTPAHNRYHFLFTR